jgi:hypothetical protein
MSSAACLDPIPVDEKLHSSWHGWMQLANSNSNSNSAAARQGKDGPQGGKEWPGAKTSGRLDRRSQEQARSARERRAKVKGRSHPRATQPRQGSRPGSAHGSSARSFKKLPGLTLSRIRGRRGLSIEHALHSTQKHLRRGWALLHRSPLLDSADHSFIHSFIHTPYMPGYFYW